MERLLLLLSIRDRMKPKGCEDYRLKMAFDLLSKCNGRRVLDEGCGDGSLEQHFVDRDVIGLDISGLTLKNAKESAPHAEFIQADIRNPPLKDECVDIVAMIAVLGGVPRGEEVIAFREAKRLLRRKGYLILLVSQKRQLYSLLVPDRLFSGWRWRHFDPQLLQRQLQEVGFDIHNILFTAGILSLTINYANFFWDSFWYLLAHKIIRRLHELPLPSFINKLLGLEFHPFKGKSRFLARYIYIVAQKG